MSFTSTMNESKIVKKSMYNKIISCNIKCHKSGGDLILWKYTI